MQGLLPAPTQTQFFHCLFVFPVTCHCDGLFPTSDSKCLGDRGGDELTSVTHMICVCACPALGLGL